MFYSPKRSSNWVVHMAADGDIENLQKFSSRLPLGVGVGLVPGHHKPQKWTIQTHSFSGNQIFYESVNYEKSYGSLKLVKKLKNHWNSSEISSKIPKIHGLVLKHRSNQESLITEVTTWKKCQQFAGVFFHAPKCILIRLYLIWYH